MDGDHGRHRGGDSEADKAELEACQRGTVYENITAKECVRTTVKKRCAIIDGLPPADVRRISMRSVIPVAPAPIMYRTDMALVVVSMTEKSSVIVSGQSMSETLKPGLSSLESTLAGLNAKTAERSEQLVTLRWLSKKYPSQYANTYTE